MISFNTTTSRSSSILVFLVTVWACITANTCTDGFITNPPTFASSKTALFATIQKKNHHDPSSLSSLSLPPWSTNRMTMTKHNSIKPTTTTLQMSSNSINDNHNNDSQEKDSSLRTRLRTLTGFSWTALRTTLRTTTGISLTAIRLTVGATTSRVVSQTMKFCLSIFPAWARYFVQPFLVLYYWPLLTIKSLCSHQTRQYQEQQHHHDVILEKWKQAIQIAEQKATAATASANAKWPVHVDEETGNIITSTASNNEDIDTIITNGVAESVEVVMESKQEE
mmetsp:Transcript_25242/g.35591  ORF Transcript_25242/g.35591 Transcript_25242/m.35591 type:complete len:280 (-) Transcript_25242:52-891(-)